MNLGHVSRLLSGFILFFTLSLVVPLAVSLGEDTQLSTSTAFGGAMLVGLAVAGLLWCAGRKSAKDFFRKEGLAVVGLAWFLAGGVAAIPFAWSGAILSGYMALEMLVKVPSNALSSAGITAIRTSPVARIRYTPANQRSSRRTRQSGCWAGWPKTISRRFTRVRWA